MGGKLPHQSCELYLCFFPQSASLLPPPFVLSFSAIASAHMLLLDPTFLCVHAPSTSVHVALDLGFMPGSVVWV